MIGSPSYSRGYKNPYETHGATLTDLESELSELTLPHQSFIALLFINSTHPHTTHSQTS